MDVTSNKRKLLTPFQHQLLEKSLQQQDLPQLYRQRIQIMLMADSGKSQAQICQTLGCSPATTRYWIHTARAGMAHLWQDSPIGRPPKVNAEYLERLKQLVNGSPRDWQFSVDRWTAKQLSELLGVKVAKLHPTAIRSLKLPPSKGLEKFLAIGKLGNLELPKFSGMLVY